MNEIKRLQQLAGIITEIKINNPNIKIPEGWTEVENLSDYNDEDDVVELGQEIVKRDEAPMDGWDEEHEDIIEIQYIKNGAIQPRDKEEYKVLASYAYGDFQQEIGTSDTLSGALRIAYQGMEDIKNDWEEEEDYGF